MSNRAKPKAETAAMHQRHADGIWPKRLQSKVSELAELRMRQKLATLGCTESQYVRGLINADLFPPPPKES